MLTPNKGTTSLAGYGAVQSNEILFIIKQIPRRQTRMAACDALTVYVSYQGHLSR